MLFNRNKYSYLSMVMQYIKLVPGMAIMKIIYQINAVSERGHATSLCSFLRLLSVLSMERQKGKIELFRGQFIKPTTLSLEH